MYIQEKAKKSHHVLLHYVSRVCITGCPGFRRQLRKGGGQAKIQGQRQLVSEDAGDDMTRIKEILKDADEYYLMSDEDNVQLMQSSECKLDELWFVVHYA